MLAQYRHNFMLCFFCFLGLFEEHVFIDMWKDVGEAEIKAAGGDAMPNPDAILVHIFIGLHQRSFSAM